MDELGGAFSSAVDKLVRYIISWGLGGTLFPWRGSAQTAIFVEIRKELFSLRKWGKSQRSIRHITRGYISKLGE